MFCIPVYLENPTTSLLFQAPPIAAIRRLNKCQDINLDFCQYGARWRKRTKIIALNVGDLQQLRRLCSDKHGACSAAQQVHIQLQGAAPGGQPWTKVAEPYPPRLAREIAIHMTQSADYRRRRKLWQVTS